MAEKDKISKEVEEQIQILASEVYIQIEEKLTQLISTVTSKELSNKINVEQDPTYLALQNDYQASQNELVEKSKNLSEQIHQLEQNTTTLKKQLDDERNKQADSEAILEAKHDDLATKTAQLVQENIDVKQQLVDEINKQESSELNYQVELTQHNINFTETIERLEHENTQLKSTVRKEQEKLFSEQQSLKTVLSNKTANSSQAIEKLEQALSEQKIQLHQEQTKAVTHNQQLQNQLTVNEKERLEQQQKIAMLNESLAVLTTQEKNLTECLNSVEQQRNKSDNKLQEVEESSKKIEELQAGSLAEQKIQIQELTKQLNTSVSDLERTQVQHQQQTISLKQASEQKATQLIEQLQQAQIVEEKQQEIVVDQQTQLFDLNEKMKKKTKEEQDSKQEIEQLQNEQSQIKQQQLSDKETNDLYQRQQQQAQEISQQKIAQLEIKNQELINSLIIEQADIQLYQKEVSTLKSEMTLAQEGYENLLNRFNTNREKQEKDNDQVRETIKYLRDENNDMITQNNRQEEVFIEKISELEYKLTEYRLKFEYAQKQLIEKS